MRSSLFTRGLLACLAAVLAPLASAQARPLELYELYDLEQYVVCAYQTCEPDCSTSRETPWSATYEDFLSCESCLVDQKCGHAPRLWEKNGNGVVTQADYDLAILEQLLPDDVCYADLERTIVRPPALCAGPGCLSFISACIADPTAGCAPTGADIRCEDEEFGPTCWYDQTPRTGCPAFVCDATVAQLAGFDVGALCSDVDGDGLPSWAEDELATDQVCDPAVANPCDAGLRCGQNDQLEWRCQAIPCDASNACGFFEECVLEPGKSLATCRVRAVCDGAQDAVLPQGAPGVAVGEICDPKTGACVACVHQGHCSDGERCTPSGACVSATACITSLDCVDDGHVCDAAAGFCVGCLSSAECADGQACTAGGGCVASCDSDLDCTADGQLCNIPAGHCAQCVDDSACDFASVCVRGTCRARQCSDGALCQKLPESQAAEEAVCPALDCHANLASPLPACTAFHLEKVAEDDLEVLVHVHYDFTPIPARVLDLYLDYDAAQLTLHDARPLPALGLSGKKLASSHLSDGTLLLNVFDDDATHPLPNGPIVELVFRRVGSCPTEVGFTKRLDLLPLTVAPLQGDEDVQKQLGNPLLWGPPVRLCARSQVTPKTRLWYGFESLADPLAYSRIPSANDLCERVPECAFEPDSEAKSRLISRLKLLQRGGLLVSDEAVGVTGGGVYLDGGADHLRLPVHYEEPLTAGAQSFSMSTWYTTEGNSDAELSDTPQVLFTHNAYNERTVFGLMSLETGNDQSGLAFFVGDLLDPDLAGAQVLASAEPLSKGTCAQVDALAGARAFWLHDAIELRTWHHVAFTMDADYDVAPYADDARFTFYVDGVNVGCVVVNQPPDAVQCPQFFAGTDVTVHDEGDVLGGRAPEFLYVAARRSNLMKIERMDPAGLQTVPVIGDTQFNYQDPDYSPILDRIVYASNASGNMEIWIADGDGTNRKQITAGFGDSFRQITARRPRWAPDGSAIVFDSNIYDVLAQDNSFERVRHVYYVEYDPIANKVAVRLADNSTTETLDYVARLQDQTIGDYRLTTALDRHHKAARWLTGRDANAPGRERGALLLDTSKANFSAHRPRLLTIPEAYPLSKTESVDGLGIADDIVLLDAFHSEKAAFPKTIVTERALISRQNTLWEPESAEVAPQFEVQCDNGSGTQVTCTAAGEHQELVLVHAPNGYHPDCWDANFNGVAEGEEDRNDDGFWNEADCTPYELDLYVSYDESRFTPVLDLLPRCTADRDCDGGSVCVQERCELAHRSLHLACTSDAGCGPNTFCGSSGKCQGLVQTVLPCATASDCFSGSPQLCHFNQCKAAGTTPAVCLTDSDCNGDWICDVGRCVPASAVATCTQATPCSGGQVCAPKPLTATDTGLCSLAGPQKCTQGGGECAQTERCEAGQCKVLGRIAVSGATATPKRTKGCVVDVDCDGGQVCLTGECAVVTGPRTCTTDAGCEGGSVCSTAPGLCRRADEAMLLCPTTGPCAAAATGCGCTLENGTCEVDSECAGGQVCYAATGKCRKAVGEAQLSRAGAAVFSVFGKKMRLSTRFTEIGGTATSLVRVQLLSPQSAKPLVAGEIARLLFVEKGSSAKLAFAPEVYRQRIHSELVVKNLQSPGLPTLFDPVSMFDFVDGGTFAPDGDRLMLAAITNARPILLRTAALDTALDAQRITVNPLRTKGVQWVRQTQFYACNWVGGYVHPQSKSVFHGFRGAIDDLKVHAGLRDPAALRSEAERGVEFLVQNGQDGQIESQLPSCGNSHVECPPFHLCIDSECQMVACDPSDPWSCASVGARCTLRPESVEQENPNQSGSTATWDWVCAADCNIDNQCFTQACLNGPCRFCDTGTLTCIECRESVQQLGAIQIAGVEGCPDQRSFECAAGACLTDCYAFEDDTSVYLCDPTTEYCDRGKCVLLDWDWWDLAPATLSGLGEVRRKVPADPANSWYGYTQAVDQRIPIQISAYGAEDWLHSPEMVVEVRGGPFYGDAWQRIAKLQVHHRTSIEAQSSPYVVTSPRPFNDMRLRLVTSPYANLHGTATGLRANDGPFCVADYLASVTGATEEAAGLACSRLAQGSRYSLGFPINVTVQEAIDDCKTAGHMGCPTTLPGEANFLRPGANGVVVLDAFVDGGSVMNNITQNKVCRYVGGEGPLLSVEDGADAKIAYGRLGDEQSNQAAALLAACAPNQIALDFAGLWTGDDDFGASANGQAVVPGDGVSHGLSHAAGRVAQAMVFDAPSDYLSVPPQVVHKAEAFTFETWIRTGDVDGGILSVFARPASCLEWQQRGRTENGTYTIWPDTRSLQVYCEGMDVTSSPPQTYIELPVTHADTPFANTSRYIAGGGSFGTPVQTHWTRLRFDPQTLSVDLADATFATDNGGRLGHACGAPPDPQSGATLGCFRENGGLRHLWRAEYDGLDTAANQDGAFDGLQFVTGRVGQAFEFSASGVPLQSAQGLPATTELTAEAWIRTDQSAPMVLLRQGAVPAPGAWALSLVGGLLRFEISGATDHEGNAGVLFAPPTDAVDDGQWHHVSVVVEGLGAQADVLLYVDGQEVANNRAFVGGQPVFWTAPAALLDAPIVVGKGTHGAQAFLGAMDEVGVWSTALSDIDVLRLFELADPTTTDDGQGGGKCLPEEVDDLRLCIGEDMVTTLPLGVVYGCADDRVAQVTLDLTGTPFAFDGVLSDLFASFGDDATGTVAWLDADHQRVRISGGGGCGGTAPTGWSGDPTQTPAAGPMWVGLSLLTEHTATPADCAGDMDCIARSVDEVLALDVTPHGLELRTSGRAYQTVSGTARLSDFVWHHIAVVRESSALTVTVDGATWLVTQDVPSLSPADLKGVDRIVLGQSAQCAFAPEGCTDRGAAFEGRLDEVAFYPRALETPEIAAILKANKLGRPVPERPHPVCADEDAGLVEFDRKLYGHALLNCNFADADPTGDSASIDFQNIVISREWPAKRDAIVHDDGDTCLVEITPTLVQPCYEWLGADTGVDAANGLISFGSYVPFQTLEVSLPRSFGHDEGFDSLPQPTFALRMEITGLAGSQQVEVDWDPRTKVSSTTIGNGTLSLANLMDGRDFQARVVTQPAGARCGFLQTNATEACGTCVSGTMSGSARTLPLECQPVRAVAVKVSFVDSVGTAVTSPDLLSDLVLAVRVDNLSQSQALRLSSQHLAGKSEIAQAFSALTPVDGEGLTLTFAQQPGGYSCVAAPPSVASVAGDVTFVVTCSKAPDYPIELDVAGLATGAEFTCDGTATGLRLILEGNGTQEAVCVSQDGVVTSSVRLLPGDPWSVSIAGQPIAPPPRHCTLSSAAGTLPAGGLVAGSRPVVTCVEPDNVVSGKAFGLGGPLEVALQAVGAGPSGSDQTVSTVSVVGTGGAAPAPVDFAFVDAPQLDGVEVQLLVLGAPVGQACVIDTPALITPIAEGIYATVTCTDIPDPVYYVSGTIQGLQSPGLELTVGLGAEKITLGAGAQSFAFNTANSQSADYEVNVDGHPDGQWCDVLNGVGKITDHDITNVLVQCHLNTVIRVVADAPQLYGGARVKAFLVRTGAQSVLAGRIDGDEDSPQVVGGKFEFEMVGEAPTDSLADSNPQSSPVPTFGPIIPGNYALFVVLGTKVSQATGDVLFPPGSTVGAWVTFTVGSPAPAELLVDISATEFLTTRSGTVIAVPAKPLLALDDGAELVCAWSPHLASPPVPPFKGLAPVIGFSRFQCDSKNGCKLVTQAEWLEILAQIIAGNPPDAAGPTFMGNVVTIVHDPLPSVATLDVTCWADADDDQKNNDFDVLSIGDHYGHLDDIPSGAATVPLSSFSE